MIDPAPAAQGYRIELVARLTIPEARSYRHIDNFFGLGDGMALRAFFKLSE
jgi:hypothetical protein